MQQIFGDFLAGRAGFGLLVFRAVIGAAMMQHGWTKIQAPFGWMKGAHPAPPVFQALAALAEFGGGAALIVGLLTPLAALGIICTMLVAIFTSHSGDPWIGKGRTSELASLYLVSSILLLFIGPGRFSLDAILFGMRAAPGGRLPRAKR